MEGMTDWCKETFAKNGLLEPPVCLGSLSYRIVDVTTVKELAKRWYGDKEALINFPPKKEVHLALDDIRESIDMLKYCREHFFAK
uniref:Exonuclease domain-containing protein n=1 Tax=Globodera pallida TaxID=36090 RepID=A0A183CD62_GLOPA